MRLRLFNNLDSAKYKKGQNGFVTGLQKTTLQCARLELELFPNLRKTRTLRNSKKGFLKLCRVKASCLKGRLPETHIRSKMAGRTNPMIEVPGNDLASHGTAPLHRSRTKIHILLRVQVDSCSNLFLLTLLSTSGLPLKSWFATCQRLGMKPSFLLAIQIGLWFLQEENVPHRGPLLVGSRQ